MKIYRQISVSTSFEFVHCWPEAPEEVQYLQNPHRHVFHVNALIEVFHDDRELEFIMVKHFIDSKINAALKDWLVSTSCEQMCDFILHTLQSQYGSMRDITVSVFEDGENGAVMSYIKN